MKQDYRSVDWMPNTTEEIVNKINAGDSFPGVLSEFFGKSFYLYGACEEGQLEGLPGKIIARRAGAGAICRATVNGAIWISHLRRRGAKTKQNIKLPAAQVLGEVVTDVPEVSIPFLQEKKSTYQDIYYEEENQVGYPYFNFHNGAMNTK